MPVDFAIAAVLVGGGWIVVTLTLAASLRDSEELAAHEVRVRPALGLDAERRPKPIPTNRTKARPTTPAT
jgi:hypothetical protein